MICLGSPQMSPSSLQSEAAQLHVVSWFRDDFLRRYPSGIVISELEYMGRTTSATEAPTPLRTWPDLADIPRKDAPHLLVDNGSIYWCRTAAFLEQKSFYGRGLAGYWMPPERSIDVDTAHDLELLTYYFSRRGSAPEETRGRP